MSPRKARTVSALSIQTAAAIDNMAATWALVDELRPKVLPVRPPNSFTVYEYAARYSCDRKTADNQLKRQIGRGLLARDLCLVPTTDGRLAPTWCYSVCK